VGLYRFGQFELDVEGFSLKRDGKPLSMQPKVFDVLCHLVEHSGTLVTKDELLHAIWRDVHVNESAVAWTISHIRRALGQQGGRRPIETVSGRGYRFTAEVIEIGAGTRTPAATPPADHGGSPLIGRGPVMAELEQRARDAIHKRGSLCVITGDAGIGKTRCADELAAMARGLGLQVLAGRCPQEPALPILWPIAAALSALARERPDIAARARKLLGDAHASAALDASQPSGARFRLIEQVASLLDEVAAFRPTLLILDDLHWADAGTLDLLGFMAPELRSTALCVVVTLRDGELQPGSARDQPLRRLLRHAHATPLATLDADQVAQLAESIGHHRPSDALAEAVRRAAGGIPLFALEVVRSLLREHGEQALLRLTPESVRPPLLARDLLRVRIERLPDATRELLGIAAVIGDSFDLSLLLALSELEPESLLERLDPAVAEGHLRSEAPHTYRFVHSLFQSVLYDDLSATRKVAIHRKLGNLLLSRPSSERNHAEVARHFYLSLPAGDHRLVIRLAREAGDTALRALAHEAAVVHYEWALKAQTFGGEPDKVERAELLLALATAQRMAGRTHDALETTARLLELAQQQRMDALVVGAVRLRRPTVIMTMVPDALGRSALETVLAQLPDEPSATRVSALSQLALMPPYSSNLVRSKQLSARAVELASALSDPEPTFEAMRARLFSLSGPDDLGELLELTEHMLRTASGAQIERYWGDAMTARHSALILAGRIGESDEVLQRMTAAVQERHLPEGTFFCQRLWAQRCLLDGNFDEADRRWKALHAHATRAGVSYADLFYNAHTFTLALEREGAKAVRSRMIGSDAALANMTPTMRASGARIAAEAGELDAARSHLSALGDPHGFSRDAHYLNLLANLAATASLVEDKPRCDQLYALLAPYADLNTPSQMGYYLGAVSHFLGLLADARGRSVRATAYFERALELNEKMGYRSGVVRTLLAHGKLNVRVGHGRPARDQLTRARDVAQELGMCGAKEDAEAALRAVR
jgi:DNA-binding winged helix-turn-helix (wHTH) protein